MKCTASVMLYPSGNKSIGFETHATTKDGVLKATGRELWKQLGHDPISVWGIKCGKENENPMSGKFVSVGLFKEHDVIFREYDKTRAD